MTLNLKKETLAELSADELTQVVGGLPTISICPTGDPSLPKQCLFGIELPPL